MKTHLIALALSGGIGLLHFNLTALAQPAATTLAASSIGSTNATLNGTVNPNGAVAAAYFQYGLTTNYGNIGGFLALPATNTAQTLPGLVVNALTGAAGINLTQTGAPVTNWAAIASSADGTRLAAASSGIYVSTNSGATWTPTGAPILVWVSIASSADGTRLAAATGHSDSGRIYVSTNSGVTWTQTSAPTTNWGSISTSADGMRLAAAVTSGGIYTSTNGGLNWTLTSAPAQPWYGIASSADGTRLAAGATFIYTSTNSGVTWTQTSAPNGTWSSIASSADGNSLVAAVHGVNIYTSTNGGVTWTGRLASNIGWKTVASSADGTRLAAAAVSDVGVAGGFYTSTNSGLTWQGGSLPLIVWASIALSADGSKVAAVGNGHGIYTSTGTVSPLTPGTTYHYRAVGLNSVGTTLGSDLSFTTLAQPAVATLPATSITSTSATLSGTVNPNLAATSAYFRYGLTTNYGSYSVTNALSATNVTLSVSNLISSLTPGAIYHFQLVASNSVGTALGGDLSFTTLAQPAVTTLPATSMTSTSATLNGTINPNGAATSAYFRYGLTTSYGSYSATNALVATNVALSVSNLIGTLAPGTTYHFQLVASNSVGTSLGSDLTFTTGAGAPTMTTLPASGITATNATLNGTVNPNGAATSAYFRYGLTTNYGSFSPTNALAASNVSVSVSSLISNLAVGTIYHFQLVAGNSVGASQGNDQTFPTAAATPTPTTLAATNITATNALLAGTVNPNGAVTTAYFRYGLTTNYGSFSATNTLAATNVTLSVSNLISNLTVVTIYHFQLVASNSGGLAVGGDLAFTTQPLPPLVTTLPATSITQSNATLNGTVNPNGATTTAYFQYGLTTNYGNIGGFMALPATNATQTLPGLVVSALTGAAGANWTNTGAPVTDWNALASSADGTRLAATFGTSFGGAYVSTNGGVTWSQASLPSGSWKPIACSADGSRMAVGWYGSRIYYSMDSGRTWTQSSGPSGFWVSIASSANGMQMAAVSKGGGIYTSMDGGATWTQTGAPVTQWNCIASSADGTRLAAGVASGVAVAGIYVSTNSGVSWTQTSASSLINWKSIASSADGMRLAAAMETNVWISPDGGGTWTSCSLSNVGLQNVASSADGTRLAAAVSLSGISGIYYSTNSGSTWTKGGTPSTNWQSVASSADGSGLVGIVYNGGIYASTGPINNLTAGTTYHYRAVGLNTVGTSSGNDLTFTPSAATPTVATLAASSISSTSATLNGTVNPNAAATSAYFRYGLTTNYGSYSATNALTATNVTLSVSNMISNLAPGTTYHFLLVASNSTGASLGSDLTFTTSAGAPTVTTLPASGITATNATLNGTVNPNGAAASAYFRYGLTTNYGSYSATNALAATNVAQSLSDPISNLTPGTTYHFQLVASNSVGSSLGSDLTYTTSAGAPTVTTLPASGITATNATLNGTVNPNGAATSAYFRYGLTTNYGSYSATNVLAATNVTLSVSRLVSNLAPGTTYHFQLVASNSVGSSLGSDLTFTTSAGAPTVTTLPASGITATNATLNGTVNPNGAATSAYFRYGATTNYGSYSATNALAATNATLSVANLISNLTPGTTYHLQLVAGNGAGTYAGADLTFTTLLGQALDFSLNGAVKLPGGAFQFSFTNLSGLSFTVLGTTNVALPLTNWTVLGAPVEAPPGHYQFTDPQATNTANRFYSVRSP